MLVEDGLEDVLLVTGHHTVYVEVVEVPTKQELLNRIHKVVTQEQMVVVIKEMDISR